MAGSQLLPEPAAPEPASSSPTPEAGPASDGLPLRLATASLAGALVLGCTLAGGAWFSLLVLAATGLAAWELAVLQARAGLGASLAVSLLAAWAFPLATALKSPGLSWALLAFAVVIGLGKLVLRPERRGALAEWGTALAGGLYPGLLLAPSILLRERDDGRGWVVMLLLAAWACDTAAFVVGRRWGRHKLAPAISPGKSVEGVIAGVSAAMVVAVVGAGPLGQPLARLVGLGLVVGLGAVLGDLAESALKRQLGAKDAGWLMPGHGGLLDRMDSLLAVSFLGYLYLTLTDGTFWQ